MLGRDAKCDCGGENLDGELVPDPVATYAWETAGRGWKFVCDDCYTWSSELLKCFMEPIKRNQFYPQYDYVTRTLTSL